MSKAFVAGATGYTGRAIVERLCELGVPTVAHIRPGSSALAKLQGYFEGLGATVDTTPWKLDALKITFEEHTPSYIFATLGTTKKRAGSEGMAATEAYERVDYGLTAMLLSAAASIQPPPRFVYLSSLGATENTRNAYLKARAKVEAELKAGSVPYTIARPSIITGDDRDEDRPGERIAATVLDGALGVLGALGAKGLRDTYSSLTGVELAHGLVAAALDPTCEGQIVDAEALRRLVGA